MRTRPAKEFPGLKKLEGLRVGCSQAFFYDVKAASFIKRHTSRRIVLPTESKWIGKEKLRLKLPFMAKFIAQYIDTVSELYWWEPIEKSAELPPPKGLYVVVGIFNDSGALLQEVIVYTGGQSLSRSLVLERRHLFTLPILRDFKAFGLYKVSLFCS